MSRSDGFAVMDVSTDIANDPKFRRLQRTAPELVAAAFTAYVAVTAESWKAGRRVTIEDAWPAILPYDSSVEPVMRAVGLLDNRGMVPVAAWRGWFEAARERRVKSRERWARYNAKRDADTTDVPRGNDVGTATSVPTVRPSAPSGPVNGGAPRPPRMSTVDRDPEMRERRDAIRERYGDGMDEPPAGWKRIGEKS